MTTSDLNRLTSYFLELFTYFLGLVTIIARDMQNLRQIAHISPENQWNSIVSFAMDNHRSQIPRYEFYFGIVNVVE